MGLDKKTLEELKKKSNEVRIKIFDNSRKYGAYHFGGALSCVEILVSLYSKILTHDDRFILSKGHAAFALYPLLQEKGYKPDMKEHPDIDIKNGIWCTTGSLGMGLPIGLGMAMAKKIKKEKGKVFVLLGEAELQEGTTWESLLVASQHELDNLVGIIDRNKCQGSGWVDKILSLGNVISKLEAFNAYAMEINGHNHSEIISALSGKNKPGKCTMIIANTIKGKGAKIMEQEPYLWHARYPTPEQMKGIYGNLGSEMK